MCGCYSLDSVPRHSCSKLVSGRSSLASSLHKHVQWLVLNTPAPMTNLSANKHVLFYLNDVINMVSNVFFISSCGLPLKPSDSSKIYFVTSAPPVSFGGSKV